MILLNKRAVTGLTAASFVAEHTMKSAFASPHNQCCARAGLDSSQWRKCYLSHGRVDWNRQAVHAQRVSRRSVLLERQVLAVHH